MSYIAPYTKPEDEDEQTERAQADETFATRLQTVAVQHMLQRQAEYIPDLNRTLY